MLDKFPCPECNEDICVTYIEPERCYRIDEHGEVQRDDNNDAFDWIPEFQFHCGNDREHDLSSLDENENYTIWKKKFVDACIALEDPEGP